MAESAAYSRRGIKGGAASARLAANINAATTGSVACDDLSTWANATANGPARAMINRGGNTAEEIEISGVSGNNITIVAGGRGLGGTSAASHDSGETIELISSPRDFDEANALVAKILGNLAGNALEFLRVNAGATDIEFAALTAALVANTPAGSIAATTVQAAIDELATFIGAKANRATSAQSIPNNTWTPVQMNAESFDSSAFHDNSTNPSRFTVPAGKAGKYLVVARAEFAANATGRRILAISVDGTRMSFVELPPPGATNAMGGEVSALLNLSVGNYVELQVFQTSGGALDVSIGAGSTDLALHLVGS